MLRVLDIILQDCEGVEVLSHLQGIGVVALILKGALERPLVDMVNQAWLPASILFPCVLSHSKHFKGHDSKATQDGLYLVHLTFKRFPEKRFAKSRSVSASRVEEVWRRFQLGPNFSSNKTQHLPGA